jgi:hypothetical protein
MRVDAPRTSALLLCLALVACRPSPPSVADPAAAHSAESGVLGDRCLPFPHAPGDPDLRGLARTHPARCCPSDYGFDPELARASCGFAAYLGESEELACVHRFVGHDRQVHELRITPILDLDLAAALALHELGTEAPSETPDALPQIRWSAVDDWRWAFVDGRSIVRRLGWDSSACPDDRMLPVLARMHEADEDPGFGIALPRVHEERDDHPRPSASLLDLELETPQSERRHPLPRAAGLLIHELLRAAKRNELERFVALLEPDARIGLPDRRQLGARASLGPEGPAAAIEQLLASADRFPIDTLLRCPELDRRVEPRVTRGEALMWCFWISEDSLDLLVLGLRGRANDGEADGRVAYLGVFPVRPAEPLVIRGEPPAPPIVPRPELVCGDPHALAYPGVCPVAEVETNEEEEDEP